MCWNRIEPAPRLPWTDTNIAAGMAGARYEGALRDIIHAFKYQGRRSLARPLSDLMRKGAADILRDADCVVPVPLHPLRRLRRGFNQAADLARGLDMPIVYALWRWRPTRSQMGLGGASRRLNVHGAFMLSPLRRATRGIESDRIEGRVVVLIDDVRTTGATLNACAVVLKQSGAREVRALTVATADGRAYSRALTSA